MSNDKGKSIIEKQIDENLRRVYQQAAAEEVPDKLLRLLQQLKEQDAQQ
jgi:hypothetical protein